MLYVVGINLGLHLESYVPGSFLNVQLTDEVITHYCDIVTFLSER